MLKLYSCLFVIQINETNVIIYSELKAILTFYLSSKTVVSLKRDLLTFVFFITEIFIFFISLFFIVNLK